MNPPSQTTNCGMIIISFTIEISLLTLKMQVSLEIYYLHNVQSLITKQMAKIVAAVLTELCKLRREFIVKFEQSLEYKRVNFQFRHPLLNTYCRN